jgi:hypothetical protein
MAAMARAVIVTSRPTMSIWTTTKGVESAAAAARRATAEPARRCNIAATSVARVAPAANENKCAARNTSSRLGKCRYPRASSVGNTLVI